MDTAAFRSRRRQRRSGVYRWMERVTATRMGFNDEISMRGKLEK
jgi:hypothetical protein